jgi:hypothetical protein
MSLERILTSDQGKPKPGITRPPMTNRERELHLSHMMNRDHFDTKLTLHELEDTSEEDSKTQVYLNRLASASNATEMITLVWDYFLAS